MFLQTSSSDASTLDLTSYLKKDAVEEQIISAPVKYTNSVSDANELATKAYADGLSQAAGATINDVTASASQVFSSTKTTTLVNTKPSINDSQITTTSAWSSNKINTELGLKPSIDDTTATVSSLYSSNKITSEIANSSLASAALVNGAFTLTKGDGSTVTDTFSSNDIAWVVYAQESDLPSATTYHGMFAHVHGTGYAYYAHAGAWVKLAKHSELGSGSGAAGTFLNLSDVNEGSHQAGKFAYSDGTNIKFTTTNLYLDGADVKASTILPHQHETQNLGSTSNRWNEVHAKYLNTGTRYTLPTVTGTSGQVLSTDGATNPTLSWTTAATPSSTFLSLTDTPSSITDKQFIVGVNSYGAQSLALGGTNIVLDGTGIKTGEINPSSHEAVNLGSSSSRWNEVHCKYLNAGTRYTLPTVTGTSGQVLSTDGATNPTLSWVAGPTALPNTLSPISYPTTGTTSGKQYEFKMMSNMIALEERPYAYTGDDSSSRGTHVGFGVDESSYGGGAVSLGYECLKPASGVSVSSSNAERSVAIGYQAGYESQASNCSIFIGPYQGYGVSAHRQLRIGNSGTPHPNTGYDKALLEGTFGLTDATQTFKVNSDMVYLGTGLPTTQPSDSRIWLNGGSLTIGAASGGVSYRKIDGQSISSGNLTIQEINGTTTSVSANGIFWGQRWKTFIIENTLVKARNFNCPDPALVAYNNGVRGGSDLYNDSWYVGGHVIYTHIDGYAIKFNAFYLYRYWAGTPDDTYGIYGSNDKVTWTKLGEFNLSQLSASHVSDGASAATFGTYSFPARNNSVSVDAGTSGTPYTHVKRIAFTNANYYLSYMIKNIAVGSYTASSSIYSGGVNTQMEFEWG